MKLCFDQESATQLIDAIGDLIDARVEHAISNHDSHGEFYPCTSDITRAERELERALQGGKIN